MLDKLKRRNNHRFIFNLTHSRYCHHYVIQHLEITRYSNVRFMNNKLGPRSLPSTAMILVFLTSFADVWDNLNVDGCFKNSSTFIMQCV